MIVALLLMWVGVAGAQGNCIIADVCDPTQTQPACDFISSNLDSFCALLPSTVGAVVNGQNCSITDCQYSSNLVPGAELFCCGSIGGVSSTDAPSSTEAPSYTGASSYTEVPSYTGVPSYTEASSYTEAPSYTGVPSYTEAPSYNDSMPYLVVSSYTSYTSPTTNPSLSGMPTPTCVYRAFSALSDFSSVQGHNGWYYGYYNGGVFTQFTSYGVSSTGSVGSVSSWNFNINSNGIISSNMMMQNGAISCNTPSYGNIAPVLRWYNPVGSCYQDMTIGLTLSGSSLSAGSIISLKVNGNTIYSFSGDPSTNSFYNVYGVRSVELSIGPINSNCDYGQTTYSLTIFPIGPSATSLSSKTMTGSLANTGTIVKSVSSSTSPGASKSSIYSQSISKSGLPSVSNRASLSNSGSSGISRSDSASASISWSPRTSLSNSHSATASSTVFYKGVWTDFVGYNYVSDGQATSYGSLTLNNCKLQCWLNINCKFIVVTSPCSSINLTSSEPDTVVCSTCWLRLTPGYSATVNSGLSTFLLNDRPFPPTISVEPTESLSASPSSSASARVSKMSSYSGTATATVFNKGIWTNLVGYNYAQGDIAQIGSMTLDQCKLRCWLNSLCGLVVVTSPCNTMDLNSSAPYSLVCGQCWLKLKSGWVVSTDSVSSSFMLYDRVFPPTSSSDESPSISPSASVTRSLATVFNHNMCSSSGGSVFLPNIGSYVNILTNAAGTNYNNNAACVFTVNGGSVVTADQASQFLITFSAFTTEDCCDRFSIVSNSATVFSYAGSVLQNSFLVPYSSNLRLSFTTDGSVVFGGVNVRITLVNGPTPSLSGSVSGSPSSTKSSSVSALFSETPVFSRISTNSATNSKSISLSGSSSNSNSDSYSPRASRTTTTRDGLVNTPSANHSFSSSFASSFTVTASITAAPSNTVSSLQSSSPFNTHSYCNSKTVNSSYSSIYSALVSNTIIDTVSAMASASLSTDSGSASLTSSKSSLNSNTNSETVSFSMKPSPTYSPFNTKSYCSSSSTNRTFSSTATYSSSMSMSKTSSASYFWRAKIAKPPTLPADLANLSADQISDAITDLGNYDPSVIKDNLQILGAAALFKMEGPLIISTDTFSLAMAKLSNSSAPLSAGPLAITVPNINISGAAASSVINWASSPYPNSTTDSPVISMNILNMGGSALSVKNLSTPIKMDWVLSIDPTDARFQPPPTYLARCDTGVIYKGVGKQLELFDGPRYSGLNWLVPCLMGTKAWINCTTSDLVKNFECPSPTFTNRCLYWSSSLGKWSDDGCVASSGTNGTMTCLCDHLTDFSARIDAVVSQNEAIFANAANVYSAAGLLKYVQWYAIFGGIALMTILLGMFVTRVDQVATLKYIKVLSQNEMVAEMLSYATNMPIFIYDAFSTIKEIDRHKEKRKDVHLNLCQRILVQHSRLGFLFRYDPRLSRLFRLLSIFFLQFHSLFITALLYGFTYGAGGSKDMMWYDTIALAVITTSLNIPMVKILLTTMNKVGLEEFKVQFPILFSEYTRRIEFEKVALLYLEKKRGLLLNIVDDGENSGSIETKHSGASHLHDDDDEDSYLDMLVMYFCCSNRKNKDVSDNLSELTVHQLLRRLAAVVKESYPYIEPYENFWAMFPCHTKSGLLYLLLSFGWIGWCLNYLLLFAASHERSVGESVMTSYATSEITTVFLTQPLIILGSYLFYKFMAIYKNKIPEWIRVRIMPSTIRSIPAVYYFSDPWVGTAKTAFTSEYAYNLFVKCPAESSGVSEEVYANQRAITYSEHPADRKIVVELKALYRKLVGTWDDIKNNR